MQPPQAVVSVFSAMAGQSRAAIDPSVQQIFRSAVFLCLHRNHECKGMIMTAGRLCISNGSHADTEPA